MWISAGVRAAPHNCWMSQQSKQSNGMPIDAFIPARFTPVGNFHNGHNESTESAQPDDCRLDWRMDERFFGGIVARTTVEGSGRGQRSFGADFRRDRSHPIGYDKGRTGRFTGWNSGERRRWTTKSLFSLFENQIHHIRTMGCEMQTLPEDRMFKVLLKGRDGVFESPIRQIKSN